MILTSLSLQHFRSYKQHSFSFSPQTTVVVGPNTAGKSNLIEAIYLLSTGKSFRAEKDTQMISFGSLLTRIAGEIEEKGEKDVLEVVIAETSSTGRAYSKKFVVNGVPKRRVDFAGMLPALLFVPSDLDIITSSPSHRRGFLDSVLELVDRGYRQASIAYEKALRQRNALLDLARETGIRNDQQFAYWDELLITNGQYITAKRDAFITYVNREKKSFGEFSLIYDHSTVSKERLQQYYGAETASGVTLVGPHRDDFCVELEKGKDVRHFGSRGQQRLVVLQLKLLQLSYIEQSLRQRPLLLLDDIFSELDEKHIKAVWDVVSQQQTILTTTHKEFLQELSGASEMIDLSRK